MKTRINKKYKTKNKYSKKNKFGKLKCKTKINRIKGGFSFFGSSKPTPNFSFSSNVEKITDIATKQGILHPFNSINFGLVSFKLSKQKTDIDRLKVLLDNPNFIIFTLKPSIKLYITDKNIRHQLYDIIKLLIDLVNSIMLKVIKGNVPDITINNIDNNIINKLMNLTPEIIVNMMRMDNTTILTNFGINIDDIATKCDANVKLSTYRIEITNFIQNNPNISLIYIIGKIKDLINTFLPPTSGFGTYSQGMNPMQGMNPIQPTQPTQPTLPTQPTQPTQPIQGEQGMQPIVYQGGNSNNKKSKFNTLKKSKKYNKTKKQTNINKVI